MDDEKSTERISELEAENERLKQENKALLKGKKMLTTSIVSPMIQDDSPRRRTILTTNEKPVKAKTLLQSHGMKVKAPEERAKEIIEAVLEKRAKAKKETKKS